LAACSRKPGFLPRRQYPDRICSEPAKRRVTHAHVAKIAFTGATARGGRLRACRPVHQAVTLELGGKSANIVFKDAAIDNAVRRVSGIFAATGQTCIALGAR